MIFTVGIAGLSFSEGMKDMNHGNPSGQQTCGHCCGAQADSVQKTFGSITPEKQYGKGIENLQPSED